MKLKLQGAMIALALIAVGFYLGLTSCQPELRAIQDYGVRSTEYAAQLKPMLLFVPLALSLAILSSTIGVINRLVSKCGSWYGRHQCLLLVVIPLFAAWAAWVSYARIGRTPRVFDAFNYYFQAQNFAAGQLYAPLPPVPSMFEFPFIMMYQGRWFGSVYPGHSLFLAIGLLFGAPWLVNPLMGAGILIRTRQIGLVVYDKRVADLALILGFLSPFLLIQSAIFMAHPTTAFLLSSACYHYLKLVTVPGPKQKIHAWLTGCFFGLAIVTRPQACFTIGVVFALHGLYALYRRRLRFRLALPILVLAALAQISIFLYNAAVTGDPLDNPRYRVSPYRRLGFGADIGYPLPDGSYSGHTLLKGLQNSRVNLSLLNAELLGWGGGFTVGLPVLLWLTIFLWPRRRTEWDVVFLGIILTTVGLYVAYFTPSPNFGPRYYFEAVPFMLLLTARSMLHYYDQAALKLTRYFKLGVPPLTGFVIFLISLYGCSFLAMRPRHAVHYYQLPAIAKFQQIEGVAELREAIVLVDPMLFLANIVTWNSPNLDADVIWAPMKSPELIAQLQSAYPAKRLYRLVWNSQEKRGMVQPFVVQGEARP